jgi:intergrase/recombinase
MRTAAIMFTLLAACSTDVTKDIVKLKDRMCECKETVCAKAVLDDLVTLAKDTRNARGDEDKAQAAAREMAQCAIKLGVTNEELKAQIKKVAE